MGRNIITLIFFMLKSIYNVTVIDIIYFRLVDPEFINLFPDNDIQLGDPELNRNEFHRGILELDHILDLYYRYQNRPYINFCTL